MWDEKQGKAYKAVLTLTFIAFILVLLGILAWFGRVAEAII